MRAITTMSLQTHATVRRVGLEQEDDGNAILVTATDLVEAWSPLYQIPIKDLSYKDVQSHLDNMDRGQVTRIHHFERLKQVISFAVDEGYLFKQHETMIDRARPPRGERNGNTNSV